MWTSTTLGHSPYILRRCQILMYLFFFWQIAHHNDDKIRDEVWTLKRRNMDPFDSDSGNDDDLLVWSTVVFGIGYGCLSD